MRTSMSEFAGAARVSALALFAGLMLAVPACSRSDGILEPTPGTMVRTDRSVYDVSESARSVTISATITNNTRETLLLDGHDRYFMALEKLVGNEWEAVYYPVYTMIAVAPIPLLPGETRAATLTMNLTPEVHPRLVDIPGKYRAAFLFGRERPPHTVHARTNEFEFRLTEASTQ